MNRKNIPIPNGQRSGIKNKIEHKNVSNSQTERICAVCETEFIPSAPSDKYCKDTCSNTAASNKYLWRTYSITIEDYKDIYEKQSGLCYICNSEGFKISSKPSEPLLVVDHNHITGKVRGLLCHNCNRALGLLKDDISLLYRGIEYLNNEEYTHNPKYASPIMNIKPNKQTKVDTLPKECYEELVNDLFVKRLRIGECADKYNVKPYVIKRIKEGSLYKIPIQKLKDKIKESSETTKNLAIE